MTDAGAETISPGISRACRVAWIPIAVVLVLALLFSEFRQDSAYENQVLLATLNTLFSGSVFLLIAGLAAREYCVSGSRAVLLLGCGSLAYGGVSLLAGLMMPRIDSVLATYSVAVCFAGACFLAAAAACLYLKKDGFPLSGIPWLLLAAYAGVLAGLGSLAHAAWAGRLPPFYARGAGPTLLRQGVMGISVAEFLAASLGFGILFSRRHAVSLLWYSLGLGLIAIGLFLVSLVPLGTLIGWLGRSAQYLGALYLLIAIVFEGRGSAGVGISIELAYRESEERYRALVGLLPDAVLVHSQGVCRFANQACLKLLGVSHPGGLMGRHVLDLVHPADRPMVATRLEPAEAGAAESRRTEFRLIRLNGAQAVVEMASGPIRYEGKPAGLVILRDITERQAREADLRRLNRALKATSISESVMMRATQEEEYLQEVCRIVGECGYSTAWIGYAAGEGEKGLKARAWSGIERADLFRLMDARHAGPDDEGPAAACIRTGEPVLAPAPQGFDLAAMLALPLRSGARAWGALVIYAPEADAFSNAEIALLEELAHDLAYGVGAIRLRESLLRSGEALRLSEERYRRLVEVSPDGILVNRGNRIVYANGALLRMVGAERQEQVLGREPLQLFDSACHDLVRSRIGTAGGSQAGPRVEGRLLRLDGAPMDVDVAAISFDSAEGPSILVVMRDMTARKRYEEVLQRTARELARSNHDLEQFAHVTSHDLKEPLRMVTGFLSLLKERYESRLDEKGDEYIHFAVDAASRMQRLIDGLLTYSRVGRSGERVMIRAADAVDAALKNLTVSVEESGALIACGDLPDVWANVLELTQLFQNLLGNAIKFRGPDRPEIRIGAERQNGDWLFRIRDNGIGIDPRFSERVFQLFSRLHTAEAYAGTGIGLAICKKVVERHGGRIWVESESGRGATFCFTLPADRLPVERTG